MEQFFKAGYDQSSSNDIALPPELRNLKPAVHTALQITSVSSDPPDSDNRFQVTDLSFPAFGNSYFLSRSKRKKPTTRKPVLKRFKSWLLSQSNKLSRERFCPDGTRKMDSSEKALNKSRGKSSKISQEHGGSSRHQFLEKAVVEVHTPDKSEEGDASEERGKQLGKDDEIVERAFKGKQSGQILGIKPSISVDVEEALETVDKKERRESENNVEAVDIEKRGESVGKEEQGESVGKEGAGSVGEEEQGESVGEEEQGESVGEEEQGESVGKEERVESTGKVEHAESINKKEKRARSVVHEVDEKTISDDVKGQKALQRLTTKPTLKRQSEKPENNEAALDKKVNVFAPGSDVTNNADKGREDMAHVEAKREHLYKILVIGELGTGKTSIIKRYVHQFFSQHYRATIGVDFALKVLNWDQNTIIRLQLWDIAGQERFGSMTRVYYKEAVGAFIVFDVTRAATFDAVLKWKQDLDSKVQLSDGSPIPCILLANKCDQPKEGLVNHPSKMDEYCRDKGFSTWYETSAKENTNIEEAARSLVNKILQNDKLVQNGEQPKDNDKFALDRRSDKSSNKSCSC